MKIHLDWHREPNSKVIVLKLTLVVNVESFCLTIGSQWLDYHWQYVYVTSRMCSLIWGKM